MEATFFIANAQQAAGVRQYDDIPTEPIGEPIEIPGAGALVALATAISGVAQGPLKPLRDATCQSYPIFCFEGGVVRTLRDMKEDELDGVAECWFDRGGWHDGEVDLYELAEVLRELRSGLAAIRNLGDRLYILLEEKAW